MTATASLPARWPRGVRAWLRTELGRQIRIEPLGGMSGSHITRVSAEAGSAIIKASENPNEARFYDQTASRLRDAGIALPQCFLSEHAVNRYSLILEDIPTPLPRAGADGLPDARVLSTLARLHALTLSKPPCTWWEPCWPAEMTDAALMALGNATPALDITLRVLRDRTQHLFAPRSWISGDPNPTNWGTRDDGSAVLFDWERFGRGAPAIDLAITIAGLGNPTAYRALASRACHIDSGYGPVDDLARDIALAKCWTAVELLAGVTRHEAQVPASTLTFLRQRFPGWIRAIAAEGT